MRNNQKFLETDKERKKKRSSTYYLVLFLLCFLKKMLHVYCNSCILFQMTYDYTTEGNYTDQNRQVNKTSYQPHKYIK